MGGCDGETMLVESKGGNDKSPAITGLLPGDQFHVSTDRKAG